MNGKNGSQISREGPKRVIALIWGKGTLKLVNNNY